MHRHDYITFLLLALTLGIAPHPGIAQAGSSTIPTY